ncbi:MAG: hypothetical protein FJ211_03325 [Ignavibacteria bacterium]|nr:hypothetical protein [Ignavibacteria bacterium]
MIAATLALCALIGADEVRQDAGQQSRMIEMWKTKHSEFAPCYDAKSRQWFFSVEIDGATTMYHAVDTESLPTQVSVQTASNTYGLGFLTVSAGGDAYAVAYAMGTRQSHATIVNVSISEKQIIVTENVLPALDEVFSTSPSISPDGTTMVFVSDRPGGLGGTDLWYMEKQLDGSWGAPQHCGEALNSPRDEMTPHFVSSDTLLLSSNGFGGQGGMDVFQSVYKDGRWQDPIPVDAVNTSNDETDAVIAPSGECVFARNSVASPSMFHLYRIALTDQ